MRNENFSRGAIATSSKVLDGIKFNTKENIAEQAFGKCKCLFMVEAYKNHLAQDKALTADVLDTIESDCEMLSGRAMRDTRLYSKIIDEEEADSNEPDDIKWARNIFKDNEPKMDNPASDAQKKLIKKLAAQKIINVDARNNYLNSVDDLDKIEASAKIQELFNL